MWNLMRKDFKELICNRKIWCFVCIVSIIFIIGTCCSQGESSKKKASVTIGIVDNDNSFYSKLLVQYFSQNESFQSYANVIVGREKEMEEQFLEGSMNAYVVIPLNFADNLMKINNNPIAAKINTSDTTTAIILKTMLESYEKYISSVEMNCVALLQLMQQEQMPKSLVEKKNFEISKDLIFMVLDRNHFFENHIENEFVSVPLKEYYKAAIVAILILYLGMYGGFSYLREKENQCLERLHLTNISYVQHFLSKVIMNTVLFSVVLCGLFGIMRINGVMVQSWKWYGSCVASIFMSNCMGMCLAYVSRTSKIYLLLGNIVYFCICMIGGGMIPVMYLPDKLIQISKLTPIYWWISMLSFS